MIYILMMRTAKVTTYHGLYGRFLILAMVCFLLQACVSPAGKLDQLAREQGFVRSSIKASGFRLLTYSNRQANSMKLATLSAVSPSVLHVYLEGDGSPWRYRTIIMPDPTPRQPLMLTLMKHDKQPAIYLGRPCYNGTSSEPGCDNSLWTSGRYSAAVVDSMAVGLRTLMQRHRADELWLLGHSGGGALAMLLAQELADVTRVVTIAGNLNTDAWTQHHGYTPLYGSINPANTTPLRSEVEQWHLVGGNDSVIPPLLVRPFILSQPQASGFLIKQFSHGCCWALIWSDVLSALAADDPTQVPARRFKLPNDWLDASEGL